MPIARRATKHSTVPAEPRQRAARRRSRIPRSGVGARGELSQATIRSLRRALLAWFARSKRDLPWRADRDAYRVWISEAMLQQTRVEAVLDHYRRFLARFPTLAELAAAEVDDVLAQWSGLGYYRRARTLHAAARAIVERHGGSFPERREDALALPGIGPYTAGAVLSIAFDAPEALVDGNVARVLARLFEIDGETSSKRFQDATWDLARALVPRERGAGDWNQALMELGALVCTPRAPRCDACPLARPCRALASGRVDELPRARTRKATIDVELVLAWIERDGELVLERRPEGGRMAGLWQLPTIERGAHGHLAPLAWPRGTRLELGDELLRARHAITHHRIELVVRRARCTRALPPAWKRQSFEELGRLALSGMTRKALRARSRALVSAGP